MNRTVPASLFSCSSGRREGRIRDESRARLRPGPRRSRRTLRQAACCAKRAYLPRIKPLAQKPRTANLGPFGELLRSARQIRKGPRWWTARKIGPTAWALLVFSYCPSVFAFVGRTAHDWSAVVPLLETRVGIVEWQTGTSTVYCGFFDFSLPFGAHATAAVLATACGLILVSLIAIVLRREGA